MVIVNVDTFRGNRIYMVHEYRVRQRVVFAQRDFSPATDFRYRLHSFGKIETSLANYMRTFFLQHELFSRG